MLTKYLEKIEKDNEELFQEDFVHVKTEGLQKRVQAIKERLKSTKDFIDDNESNPEDLQYSHNQQESDDDEEDDDDEEEEEENETISRKKKIQKHTLD